MKIRKGFVSNSSSTSFVIDKSKISEETKRRILDFMNYAKSEEYEKLHRVYVHAEFSNDPIDLGDIKGWRVTERDSAIVLSTIMDNFDMGFFLGVIGVPGSAIEETDFYSDPERAIDYVTKEKNKVTQIPEHIDMACDIMNSALSRNGYLGRASLEDIAVSEDECAEFKRTAKEYTLIGPEGTISAFINPHGDILINTIKLNDPGNLKDINLLTRALLGGLSSLVQ